MVPPGTGNRQLVVGEHVGALLRLGPVRSHHHRNLGDAELPGGEYPGVARNQATVLAHQRQRRPAPLLDARGAFAPEQFAQLYDVNVLSTQRVNRAVLPHPRRQKQGLVVWVSSSSSAGGTPPYLAPYFAAKAGMDAMAVAIVD